MPSLEPVGLDFIDRAAVVARAEVRVDASPARVWEVLNDTPAWPTWFASMKEARVTSPTWDGVGSTRFVQVGPLGVHEKVVAWEPERQWGFYVEKLSLTGWIAKRMLEVVDIEPDGTGSTLRYTGALDPVPWLKPLGGKLEQQLTTAWQTSLAAIT